MKKIVKYCFVVVGAIALLVITFFVTKVGGSEIAEGTYKVKDSVRFSDAYISVTDNRIQFFNIDLNSIYREAQMNNYTSMIEHGLKFNLTEEQLEEISDLNNLFVENSYEIDYDEQEDSKDGTFTYIYFCYVDEYPFGLVLEYNALHKTLQINSPVQQIIFEQQ